MSAQDLTSALVQSMVGPLANKVKMSAAHARKNKKLGAELCSTFALVFEQLVPWYCAKNMGNLDAINNLHNLLYLLAGKAQGVFNSPVIHTAIDQNWDLKGLKQVLLRTLKTLEVGGFDSMTALIDSQIKNQNLQSSSCIKAINSFIRNPKKAINQDDLVNSIHTYESDFEFIRADIEKYRAQRIKHECFSVLHPWAYDLDNVDFKYILNNNITQKICDALPDMAARVFWLTHFKCQSSVASDDLHQALREGQLLVSGSERDIPHFRQSAVDNNFVFSLNKANDAERICHFVKSISADQHRQVRSYAGNFEGPAPAKIVPSGFETSSSPSLASLNQFHGCESVLLMDAPVAGDFDLQRKPAKSVPNQPATHKLYLKFEAVDTEEIKGLGITFDGTEGIFKIGEGDTNHYQIPNDKKLWESQLMIVCKDGKYFVRDCGIVHTSRIKIDKNTEV